MAKSSTTENRTKPLDAPAVSSNGDGRAEVEAALAAVDRRSTPRRWPALVLGLALGGAAAWIATIYWDDRGEAEATDQEVVELATAPVEQRDLQEEIEWSGTLGYGEPVTVNGNGGTVTTSSAIGATLDRGDTLVTVDAEPVVVLFGDTPMWRDLSQGTEGRDVLQLEANLAALGYDPDQTVDIDETFTANTAAMVERWQEDLGSEPTGTVPLGTVVIVEGPSAVVSSAEVGSTATGPVASLAPRRTVTDIVAGRDGTVTALPSTGLVIEHGETLVEIDDVPILALTELDSISLVLTDGGFTVTALEQALADAGHDPTGDMTVDGVVTDATRAAMERWQSAAGLPVTGDADPGSYQLVPIGQTVDEWLVAEQTSLVTGGPVLTISSSQLSVDLVVDVEDADDFELGQPVTIELADGATADGVVADIGAVVAAADPQASPTVEITIEVVAGDEQALIEGPVTVISVGEVVEGATVVPTRSLVALAEGGFAVEVANSDGSSSLIGVELGTFDDGLVEVVDGDLQPGDDVVVPR